MKEKIITKELAKLYEKQGYFEDSLACYISLYEQDRKQEFADAIERLKNRINPQAVKDNKAGTSWYKTFSSKEKEEKSNRTMVLFEQWLNMIVLEKKVQNFKKNHLNHE
jgi:quinol monooxygenase YgiN